MGMVNQPNVKKVLGDVKMCEKMAQFDAKKYNELHGKAGGDNKKEKKKAEPAKPKQEKKPEPAKPAAAPAAAAEEPKPQKQADPFANEAKGNMDLDAFKRCYSNSKDIAGEAVPYFWEHIDKEAYSIWVCDYKENLKGKMSFQVGNLIGGFFQRLEKLNKNAFARMLSQRQVQKSGESPVCGSGGHKSLPLSFQKTGRLTTNPILGASWTSTVMSARS